MEHDLQWLQSQKMMHRMNVTAIACNRCNILQLSNLQMSKCAMRYVTTARCEVNSGSSLYVPVWQFGYHFQCSQHCAVVCQQGVGTHDAHL